MHSVSIHGAFLLPQKELKFFFSLCDLKMVDAGHDSYPNALRPFWHVWC